MTKNYELNHFFQQHNVVKKDETSLV